MIYTTYTRPQPKDKREESNFSSLSENQFKVRKTYEVSNKDLLLLEAGLSSPPVAVTGAYHNVSEQWLLLMDEGG